MLEQMQTTFRSSQLGQGRGDVLVALRVPSFHGGELFQDLLEDGIDAINTGR
jgi:hypothetical protein